MVIRYSRLATSDYIASDSIRWLKGKLPIPFLKQQIILVSIGEQSITNYA